MLSGLVRASLTPISSRGREIEHYAVLEVGKPKNAWTHHNGQHGVKFFGINERKVSGGACGHDKMVFVDDIELVETVEFFIPASVRLKVANCSFDLFSGDLYLSALNGIFKGLRVLSEGECDRIGLRRFVADQTGDEYVQSGSEIMNGVASDEGEFHWDGLLLFDSQKALAGLAVATNDRFERLFRKERFDSAIEVVDVMFGPLNL